MVSMHRSHTGLITALGILTTVVFAALGAWDILALNPTRIVPGMPLDQIYSRINAEPAAGSMTINVTFVGAFVAISVLATIIWSLTAAKRNHPPMLRVIGFLAVIAASGALFLIASLPMIGDLSIAFLATAAGLSTLGITLLVIAGVCLLAAGITFAVLGRGFISIWH